MKKIIYLVLLLPLLAKAQYKPSGAGTWFNTPDKKRWQVQFGVNGVITLPQFYQLDSIAALKQPTGNYITGATGDISATGPGTVVFTLPVVNANVGTFGDASHVFQGILNAKGLTTGGVSVAIQIAESQVTSLVSDLSTLTSGLATTNSNVSAISSGYANRSASQTFTGIPTFANGINTSATSNYNYPSTGNYYTSGGNQFALSGGGIAWQGGASIQNAGAGTAIIYNNGASGHIFQVGATPYLQIYSTGSGPAVGHILASVDLSNSISVTAQHFAGYGSAPTFVIGASAGSGATVTALNCTDAYGVIIITTGTSPSTGVYVTGTFSVGYITNAKVLIGPGEGSLITAQLQASANALYPVPATTTFTLNTVGSALAASTTYKFAYHIGQ